MHIRDSPVVTLSPEERLLLFCLRSEHDKDTVQQIDGNLSLDLNWTLLTEMVRGGDLAPLLYHNLRRTGCDGVPPGVMSRLQQLYLGSAGRNTIIRHELEKVLTALRDAKLDVIVLKGAALSETVYADPALRPMCDVDLLVRKEEIERAYHVLLGLGFQSGSRLSLEAQQRREHHLAALRRPGGPGLELHWTVAPLHTPFEPDLNGLWHRAQPAHVADVPVLTLSAEDTLLHVSVHTASDVPYARRANKLLRDLCDLDRIVYYCGDTLDWQEIVARSGLWRARHSVYLALLLTSGLLDTPVPDDVLDDLRPDRFDARLRNWAIERVFSQRDRGEVAGPELLRFLHAGGLFGKLRAFLNKAFPSRETMCAEYSVPVDSSRVYPLYARRAIRLVLRNCRLVWGLARRDAGISAMAEGDSALRRWLELD